MDLAQILKDHYFAHDGWCNCSDANSDPITVDQWADHVASIIRDRYHDKLQEIWYG